MHSSLVRLQTVFGFFTTVAFTIAILVALSVTLAPQNPSAKIDLRTVQVVKGRPHYHSPKKEEYAHVKFDLDADFSSLFNWNTKQVFVYITASWPSSSSPPPSSSSGITHPSQAVIWDTIINSPSQLHPFNPLRFLGISAGATDSSAPKKPRKSTQDPIKEKPNANANTKADAKPGIIRLKNSKPKYQITDISGKLASQQNVTLEVKWNVQPWVGALTWTLDEGKSFGRWKGIQGGRSSAFGMPALKGKGGSPEQVVRPPVAASEKPKPAEASAVI